MIQYIFCPYKKGKFRYRETHIEGEHNENTSYKPKIVNKPPEVGERLETDSLSQPSEETNPTNSLILDVTLNFCYLSHLVYDTFFYDNPRKLIHHLRKFSSSLGRWRKEANHQNPTNKYRFLLLKDYLTILL